MRGRDKENLLEVHEPIGPEYVAQHQTGETQPQHNWRWEHVPESFLLTLTLLLWHIYVHTYTHIIQNIYAHTHMHTLNNFLNCTAKSDVSLIALWVLMSLLLVHSSPCHQTGVGRPHNVILRGRRHGGQKAAVFTASMVLRESWKKQQLSKLCAFAFFQWHSGKGWLTCGEIVIPLIHA